MIAVDTNLLVYAHRPEYPDHARTRTLLEALASDRAGWGVPWPCAHEFLANVTNARIYREPTPLEQALAVVAAWTLSPQFLFLGEGENHLQRLGEIGRLAGAHGGLIHDARIAAICLSHGVSALWTADRDFQRFPALATYNPLVKMK